MNQNKQEIITQPAKHKTLMKFTETVCITLIIITFIVCSYLAGLLWMALVGTFVMGFLKLMADSVR